MAEDIKTEYMSSLADLTFNSKPLINVLTMLAEENVSNAKTIVEAIEEQLAKVNTDVKLPILYLIDCIVKNVGETYKGLFSHNIVATFCNVFKVVDEKTRLEMFKLRQTWNDVFPQMKLYAIDVQIRQIDPAWPVTAQPATNSIHLNPKFLKNNAPAATKSKIPTTTVETTAPAGKPVPVDIDKETLLMHEQLLQKQRELLDLQRKTLELEVLQTQVKLQEQMKTGVVTPVNKNILLKPEVAKQLMPEAMAKSRPVGITQRLQSNHPKINPVNAVLAAAARPIRDPRLLRQQPKQPESVTTVTQKPLENNKNITNKVHVKDIPNNPRTSSKIDKKSKTVSPNINNNNKSCPRKSRSPPTFSGSSSSSSQESPTKTKSRSSSSSTSNRNKKRDKQESKRSQDYDNKRGKLAFKEEPKYPNSEPNFKSVKSKNRNYVRRNLTDSPVQEDSSSSSKSAENKTTIIEAVPSHEPTSITKVSPTKPMDVDLRPVLNKKRTSTEASEQPPKKSRNLDELFGSQDTDMRPIPIAVETVERPPTPPPPPIISTASENEPAAPDVVSTKSDFDAVRAKLANAANREKILNKSFRKDKLHLESSPVRVSSEEELAITSGEITPEQKQHILSKLFKHIEKSKLREAKKRDSQEAILGDLSLQTISDDELEIEPPFDTPPMSFNDKDERLNLPQILQPQNMETIPPGIDNSNSMQQHQFYPRGGRPPFRGRGDWRGNRGRMPLPRPPIRPWIHQQPGPRWRNFGPQYRPDFIPIEDEASKSPGQDVDPQVQIQEDIKTLVIDGMPKDIRIYDETAVIFISNDDPREISFQNGSRRVCFNNNESYVLNFGEAYKECLVNNYTFRVKLGVPSREIFINDIGFECFFGGPQIHITVNGINLSVSLEGPPPPVNIGETKRTDLVLGKIDALIDAQIILPIFLDSKLQKFVLGGRPCTLKFVDALKKVLINDVPHNVEFGALPKPFIIHGKKHFIRFSVLPKGFKPGFVKIKDMEGEPGVSPVREEETSQDGLLHGEPLRPETRKLEFIGPMSPDNRSNSPSTFLNNVLPGLNNFDLSNVFSQSHKPVATTGSYQVQLPGLSTTTDSSSVQKSEPAAPALNINDLFQKLVASGFVKTQELTTTVPASISTISNGKVAVNKDPIPEVPKQQRRSLSEIIRPVSFTLPKTLKIRQGALYGALYTGMQCSSCGMRFPPEASTWYSQHLDWHFRQNRKGKKNVRVASSRKWYYSLADWKNYEELEDIEEREKNYFDQQQQQAEEDEEVEEEQEIPTLHADRGTTDERCNMCRELFEQFFNEEKEEWHLRNAIRMDDKTYHPACYEGYNQTILDESKPKEESSLIPGLEIILDDDDDDENSVNEIVSLIDDDEEIELPEEAPSPGKDEDLPEEEEDDGEDDDVILNEVAPIKIVVDDDDDDDEPMDAQNDGSDQPIAVKKEKRPVFDDGFVDVGEILTLKDHGQVTIKSEPVDDGDISSENLATQDLSESNEDAELILTTEPSIVTSHPQHVTSMDGNMELVSTTVSTMSTNAPKIKINISKPLPVIAPKEKSNSESSDNSDTVKSSKELPIEDLEIVNYKPGLQNVPLKKLPRVQKGSELTGMCSIM